MRLDKMCVYVMNSLVRSDKTHREELSLMPVWAFPKASMIGFTCKIFSSRLRFGAWKKEDSDCHLQPLQKAWLIKNSSFQLIFHPPFPFITSSHQWSTHPSSIQQKKKKKSFQMSFLRPRPYE